MTTPLIREGERSQQVFDVQARLRALGVVVDEEPGFFGPRTTQAVRTFQQQRGLLVDGIVGPDTWNELVEAGWQLGDRSLYLKSPPMRGDDVVALQSRLNALGFDAGREDGIFGHDTDEAVRAFQHEYATAEDGIFGVRSLAALSGLRVDRPTTAAGLREELKRAERAGSHDRAVIVDPGHGGQDAGGVSPTGELECDLCWDLSNRLASLLTDAGNRVRFTRNENETVDSSERARRANETGAEVFLSLHLNCHPETTAEGASTYYFPRSKAGELLAESIRDQLVELGLRDCRSHPRSYSILRETKMPAVLIEPGFITNPDEAKLLADPHFRTTIAAAIAGGVRRFFDAPG